MTRTHRAKIAVRRRPVPAFDHLEGRQLLNAARATGHAAVAVQAEVVHAKPHASKTAQVSGKAITIHNKFIHITGVQGRANPRAHGVSQATYSPVAGAFSPSQLESAYGVNQLGTSDQGQGETIAIVDEFDDTKITSDANAYSSYYGLPQFNAGGPKLTVYKDTALGSVGSAAGTGVGGETSLDVEMVHAMAPQANILLVEVPATGSINNEFAELLHGVQYGAGQPGVVAVSLSYGYAEASFKGGSPSITSLDNTYLKTAPVTNVAVTVSTGDGSTPLFPATTPDVIAVGGTSLYLGANGSYGHETAWGGTAGAGAGGGGPSSTFAAPTFQSANGVKLSTKRTVPDVSLEADPVTAVSVYDSLDANGGSPWTAFGGTSVAAPLFAGVVALAQQQRIAASLPILNSTEVDAAVYEAYNSPAYSTYFHDITAGKNSNVNARGRTTVAGYGATTGYDLATGVGSPIANLFVPYLSGYKIGS